MEKLTPFYSSHVSSNAKMVNFCGWLMPINYGSQIKEHEAVRGNCGMFDVSHMAIFDVMGSGSRDFIRYIIANDVQKLEKFAFGKALYTALLNENAGVIDDLIVYRLPFGYRIVSNAGTYAKVVQWLNLQAKKFVVEIKERPDLAMLAVQGPEAINTITKLKPHLAEPIKSLKTFAAVEDGDWLYARTGYTGENGLEIMLPNSEAQKLWQDLLVNNCTACGLAARDTLRLEAGLNLYGHDMDEAINPLECSLDWVVDLTDNDRDFIGKAAYLIEKSQGAEYQQVGLILDGKGVLREGQKVIINNAEVGVITSGTFSPSLKVSIAIARIKTLSNGEQVNVDIRGSLVNAKIVKLPFVRHGKSLITGLEIK